MRKKAGSGDWERGYGTCKKKLGVETGNEAMVHAGKNWDWRLGTRLYGSWTAGLITGRYLCLKYISLYVS